MGLSSPVLDSASNIILCLFPGSTFQEVTCVVSREFPKNHGQAVASCAQVLPRRMGHCKQDAVGQYGVAEIHVRARHGGEPEAAEGNRKDNSENTK